MAHLVGGLGNEDWDGIIHPPQAAHWHSYYFKAWYLLEKNGYFETKCSRLGLFCERESGMLSESAGGK